MRLRCDGELIAQSFRIFNRRLIFYEKTNGKPLYITQILFDALMRALARGSFKRSFLTAEHKIGDQLAFLFARDEPVITILRHHCGGIISVL